MKYKFHIFSPWLLKRPGDRVLGFTGLGLQGLIAIWVWGSASARSLDAHHS